MPCLARRRCFGARSARLSCPHSDFCLLNSDFSTRGTRKGLAKASLFAHALRPTLHNLHPTPNLPSTPQKAFPKVIFFIPYIRRHTHTPTRSHHHPRNTPLSTTNSSLSTSPKNKPTHQPQKPLQLSPIAVFHRRAHHFFNQTNPNSPPIHPFAPSPIPLPAPIRATPQTLPINHQLATINSPNDSPNPFCPPSNNEVYLLT